MALFTWGKNSVATLTNESLVTRLRGFLIELQMELQVESGS